MIEESVSKTFTQRQLDNVQKDLIGLANLRFTQLEDLLNAIPNSRLKSIALTELEKTALVVNKAISRMNDTEAPR